MTKQKTGKDVADYEVGYGKPPKHSQFKPGQSGNPKGRRKGTKNLKTDLVEELAERVAITENGKPIKVSKQRLMVKALTAKAIKGDARAAEILIKLLAQTMGLDPQTDGPVDLSAEDSVLLAEFIAHAAAPGPEMLAPGTPEANTPTPVNKKGDVLDDDDPVLN